MRAKDHIKNIVESFKALLPPGITEKQIITKSLDRVSGLEYKLQNPDTMLDDKGKDERFFDVMMMDDRISGTIALKKLLALSVPFDIVPASEDKGDVEIAEQVRRNLFDEMSSTVTPQREQNANPGIAFGDVMDNALDAMIYGNKCAEKMYAVRDGFYVYTGFKFKHPIFFDYDYDDFSNFSALFVGHRYGNRVQIPAAEAWQKFIIFTWPYVKDGNMYGASDLTNLYTQWYAKQYIFKWRNIRLQNWGAPIPNVIYDSDIVSVEEKNEMKKLLANLQDNMFILQPGKRLSDAQDKLVGKFQIDLVETKSGSSTSDYEKAIEQIDKQIARKLLIPDKAGYSESDGGSYALGKGQIDILFQVIEDIHGRLEDMVNNQIINPIVAMNYNVDQFPRLEFQKISESIGEQMLTTLVDKGIIDPREKWIRKYAKVPHITDDEKKALEEEDEENQDGKGKSSDDDDIIVDPENKDPSADSKKGNQKKDGKPASFKRSDSPFDADNARNMLDKMELRFIDNFSKLYTENGEYIISQIQKKKIVENNDMAALAALQIKKGDFKRMLSEYVAELYVRARVSAIKEIRKRAKIEKLNDDEIGDLETYQNEDNWLDRKWVEIFLSEYGSLGKLTKKDIEFLRKIRDRAFIQSKQISDRMTKDAENAVIAGIRNGSQLEAVIAKVSQIYGDGLSQYALTTARTIASDAYNTSRMNFFQSDSVRPYVEAYMYDAIMDDATTEICSSLDGQIIEKGDPDLPKYTPPLHYNCRSTLVPIVVGESEFEESYFYDYENKMPGLDKSVQPAKGFGG